MTAQSRAPLVREIRDLANERDALILAHNYQTLDIQHIADFVGDSLALAREAAESDNPVIVLCGVRFMAESAFILSPRKTVLLPADDAGCPLADTITSEQLRRARQTYPRASVVCYVNSSADVKAESDLCCTSSNAVAVVKAIDSEEILFVPDRNLALWVASQVPEKRIIPWEGHCPIHSHITAGHVIEARGELPGAILAVHPECDPSVTSMADYVGSTAGIMRYVDESEHDRFIIGTETGVLEALAERYPHREFRLLSPGLLCRNMKKTTLSLVRDCLERLSPSISVEESVRLRAYQALERMVSIG